MLEVYYKCNRSIQVLSQIREFFVEAYWCGFLITDSKSNSSAAIPIRNKEHFILTWVQQQVSSNRQRCLPSHCDAGKRGE